MNDKVEVEICFNKFNLNNATKYARLRQNSKQLTIIVYLVIPSIANKSRTYK